MSIPFLYAAIFGLGGIAMMAAVAAKMGPERTMAWHIASLISLMINVVIVQPIQVICLAAFIQYAEQIENAPIATLGNALVKTVTRAATIGQ